MRRFLIVVVGFVVAVGMAFGGFLVGAGSERPATASFSELEAGLAVALDLSAAEVRDHEGYWKFELDGCQSGTCRQVSLGPVPAPGTAMQIRLYDAGWLLHGHDEPECVSDSPQVQGWVCSYQRGDVTVSIQVESPETPDRLHIWASSS